VSRGNIVEQGTHEELMTRAGAYLQLIEAQRIAAENAFQPHDEQPGGNNELEKAQSGGSMNSEGIIKVTRTATRVSTYGDEEGASKAEFQYSLWMLIKFIWSFNKPETGIMLCGLICSIIGGSGVPLQAVYMGHNISALSLAPDHYHKLRHDVNFWSLMFFITGIVILGAFSGQGIAFAYCSERLIFRARAQTIRSLLRQDVEFFDQPENSSGALVSMLSTEVASLAGISGATLGSILAAVTTVVCALAISCGISWKLGLVCATAMPVLLCCGFLRFWVLAQFNIRAQKVYTDSASFACEATAAIRTIASLTREDEVLDMYHSMLVKQASQSLRSILSSSLLYAASQAGMFLASALGFWYGGHLIANHELSIEAFFICYAAVIFGAQSAGGIFAFAPDMGKSKQAADALKSISDRVPKIDSWSTGGEKVEDVEGAIEFRDVHFRYPTRPTQPVLRGINLRFDPGRYIALVGPSGCGKSTVVSLIERFYDPKAGGIFMDGKDITQLNLPHYRSKIALVSQEPVLYSGTIRDNIIFGAAADVDEDAIVRACKDANIYDFIVSHLAHDS
jgi:ATP-binding cassette, subfamily B (MDR/TAP), member 1